MSVTTFLAAYLVFLGLVLGSFINLAADRLPRGESVVRPRSHCRACGRQLNLVDLLPVAGWAVRGGRCASCGSRIGIASPVVEASCGACMALGVVWLGLWPGSVAGVATVALLGALVTGVAWRGAERRRAVKPR